MKLLCTASKVSWFTEGEIYDAGPAERPDIIRIDDNEEAKAWIKPTPVLWASMTPLSKRCQNDTEMHIEQCAVVHHRP